MLFSKCAICGAKKTKFIKKQEAKRILSNLGLKTPLSNVPLLVGGLLWVFLLLFF